MAPKLITGTEGIDVFITHGRFEIVQALGGDDLISESRYVSHDTILAGKGDDFIISTTGRDVISGGGGDDFISVDARSEKVYVFGGKGEDSITVTGDNLTMKEGDHGRTTITDDDGFVLVIRGVEHIDWSQ